nr:MAG TPA: hypothetical protein [Caudoviricetes sp.]DAK89977.1 MAG TPA: hypothetical protein [Caudoviricetes sp.]DAR06960.1 MAG TPA: hypothetical protein [Caudoviricetes sp.]
MFHTFTLCEQKPPVSPVNSLRTLAVFIYLIM